MEPGSDERCTKLVLEILRVIKQRCASQELSRQYMFCGKIGGTARSALRPALNIAQEVSGQLLQLRLYLFVQNVSGEVGLLLLASSRAFLRYELQLASGLSGN
jgi:hypothetical protein